MLPKAFALSLLTASAAATAAWADGGVSVPLPDIPRMQVQNYEHLLMQLVVANVVSQNCPAYLATDEEWALLTGSADLIAERIDLDDDNFDRRFYHPAFAYLDKPETCEREGPQVRPLINRLIAWGGSLTPLP